MNSAKSKITDVAFDVQTLLYNFISKDLFLIAGRLFDISQFHRMFKLYEIKFYGVGENTISGNIRVELRLEWEKPFL